jgi:hypothetical protein
MNITNLTGTSYLDNLTLNEKTDKYDQTLDDGFDLNLDKDTVSTLRENKDDINALAKAFIDDASLPPEIQDELTKFIKLKLKDADKNLSIKSFIEELVPELHALAGNDKNLSVAEVKDWNDTEITKLEQDASQKRKDSMAEFKTYLETNLNADGKLDDSDAVFLAKTIQVQAADYDAKKPQRNITEDEAKKLIANANGDMNSIYKFLENGSMSYNPNTGEKYVSMTKEELGI